MCHKNQMNRGVTCDVINCMHNLGGAECSAEVIHVGGDCCSEAEHTRCQTFKPKP